MPRVASGALSSDVAGATPVDRAMDATQEADQSHGEVARGETGQRGLSTEKLHALYKESGKVRWRDLLVERHRRYVAVVARRMAARLPPSVDVADLEHAGVWGLLQAIDSYRQDRCDRFLPFLRVRVRGAMLDELRRMDYLPRAQRRRLRMRAAAEVQLAQELGRAPSDDELARLLDVDLTTLHGEYGDATPRVRLTGSIGSSGSAQHGGATDRVFADLLDGVADEDAEAPEDRLDRQDLVAKIKASLEPDEWRVLELQYLEGKSGREVAATMDLSASRICQIHSKVMARLKERLG